MESENQDMQELMEVADLQEELLNIGDIRNKTHEEVTEVLEKFEKLPESEFAREMLGNIRKIREHYSDKELIKEFYGINAIGPVKVEAQGYGFNVVLYNPIDWIRINGKWAIFLGGSHTKTSTNIDQQELYVPLISSCRLQNFSGKGMIKHESRHAIVSLMRNEKSFAYYKEGEEERSKNLMRILDEQLHDKKDKNEKIQSLIKFLNYEHLADLKDEIAANIDEGTFKPIALFKLTSGTIIGEFILNKLLKPFAKDKISKRGYHFDDIPDFFIKVLKENYDFTDEDIKKIEDNLISHDIWKTIKHSYEGVKMLEDKGYEKSWAISYLTARDNLSKDWVEIAEKTPEKLGT